jgi:hypothetical protein
VARRCRGRPERAARTRCRAPEPELLRQGHRLYRVRRLNRSDNRGTIRGGNGLDAWHRSSYGQAVACPGTVRECAPAGTATALGALHKPELRLHSGPLPLPLRAFVTVGARCHTPNRPARIL